MKREQAMREIDSLDYYLQNHTDDYGEESHTAMMMAIKALERESILDKIRAEIKQMPSELTADGRRMIRRESAFRIIDKYKTESEVSDADSN